MTDDLDDLRAALDAATPQPDPDKRKANLRLAEKNFENLQGLRDGPRLTSDRPRKGLFRGVRNMFMNLSHRGALTATTALIAVGMIVSLPALQEKIATGLGDTAEIDFQPVATELVEIPAAKTRERTAIAEDLEISGMSEPMMEAPLVIEESLADRVQGQGFSASGPLDMTMMELGSSEGRAVSGDMMFAPPVPEPRFVPESDTEAFPDAAPNSLKITTLEPVSTFSIDVDTASYAVVRSSLMAGMLPPKEAVRIEEMVNYFPYAYPAPEDGQAFRPTVTVTDTPWNADTQLVHIGIQGAMPELDARPPLNLVFLIDTSGSMDHPDKLPLLKQSFGLMLGQLRDEDRIAIVTYAGSAGQVLEPTPAAERNTILAALDRLGAGGSTAGQAGLQQAYAVAENMAKEGDVSRVLLATDGDFNVGLSDPEALKDFIAEKRDSGTYLSVLGFGRGNLDDATMQALAQNGNGTAAYIDTLNEAQKVLSDQLTGALFPIADDVKIQVEFNPAQIVEYRLIGYETRALRREDFNNDAVDAGDIGAGHSVTALYEVTPVGSPAQMTDPLRYQPATGIQSSDELGWLKLRHKAPGSDTSVLTETPILPGGEINADMRFAMAIAGFGQLLRGGEYLNDWGYEQAIELASGSRGADDFGYRTEAIRLMRLAQSLSAR